MAKRSTVKLADIVNRANAFFLNSGDDMRAERRTMQTFVEGLLHDAGRYQGFGYLTSDIVGPGRTPGVIHDQNGPGNHAFPDDSRIMFYWRA